MGLILRSLVTCLFVTYVHGLDISFPPNDSCILVHMNEVSFNLSYDKDMRQLSGPKLDIQKSNCTSNGTTATLALKWEDKSDTMTFTFIKGTKKVEVGVVYAFIPSEHFKESKDSNLTIMDGPAHLELSMSNMSFKCNSSQDIIFNGGIYQLVMSIAQVQIQAFDVKNGSFSKFEECDMDTLTTEAPVTTTSHKLTTVPHPTTIKPPGTSLYKYSEHGSKNACILLQAAIQLDMNYINSMKEVATAQINIPNSLQVNVTGHCAKSDTGNASIMLRWPYGNSTFSMKMDFIADKGEAMLEMIQVDAKLSRDDYFPDLHDNSTTVMSKRNVDFSSSNVTYYMCNSLQKVELDNITTVVIYQIQVQAFGVNDSQFTGKGTECSQDLSTGNPTTATTPTETTNATTQTNGTTHITNTTTETTNGTTSAAISTTASVPPAPHPRNTYSVRHGNVTCVYFEAGMDFTFPYTTKNGTNTSAVVSVPQNSTADGTCDTQNVTTNKLIIYFYNWNLTFVFGPDNSSSQLGDSKSPTYSVQSIMLEYTMNHTLFPGYIGNETEMHTTKANITGPLFQSKINGSYKCNVQSEVPFIGDIKLETYDLQYKAFNKDNKTDFGGELTECAGDNSSDNKTNSIVPIAVGAALAGLVVIVLIAYLIGRRRNRKGYESV